MFCLSFAGQEVTISNISFKAQTDKELNCLAVKFDVGLKYSYNQLLQKGDSSNQYVIEVYFKQGSLLNANKGYANYRDTEGKVKTTYVIPLSNDVRSFDNINLLIPFGAIDIPEGMQDVKPVFVITDTQYRTIASKSGKESFTLLFPQKMKLHVSVKEILVSETDFKDEFWDYFIMDTNVAKPEVCWSVLLASRKINGSKHTNDNYTYHDADEKDAVEFFISKNDIFYINIYDLDMMSFSDEVGSLRIDMNTTIPAITHYISKFGKVLRMEYDIKVL